MTGIPSSRVLRVAAVVAAASLFGCTDTVYKDFPGFQPPPAAAGQYLGYTSSSGQLPVCGNCHAGHQALWATAKHSKAWADLQASGHAGPTCNACHSVSTLGNDTNTVPTGGYVGSPTQRYQDVQCESCHGPGQEHVNNPEVLANQPVPSLYVGVGVNTSCGGCHTGNHEPFVQEWSMSKHGIVPDFGPGAGNTACQPCHTGQVALLATMGVTNTVYKEMNYPLNVQMNPPSVPQGALTIVCAVCHDPHGSPNLGQTRFPVDTVDVATNLCARCHNRNAAPNSSTTTRGPHAPEGPLLIGDNDVGWRPPNMTVDNIHVSHGDPLVNTKLCATCHIYKLTSTDSNGVQFFSTGHLFLAIPCIVNGKPDSLSTCPENQRSFAACASGGCHGSPAVAQSELDTKVLAISADLNTLYLLLTNQTKIPCTQYTASPAPQPWTTARGARFNYLLAANAGTAVPGQNCGGNLALPPAVSKNGSAVHNFALIEQLLLNSISQVQHDYP
jgi:predicted CXXCH cytochrome family protein